MKDPYEIIKSRYITEKAAVLERLFASESNRCVSRCKTPKYVFIVDAQANKKEIAEAVEKMHQDKKIKVLRVNTVNVKGKPKRRGKFRPGVTPTFKKAIVTLEAGDSLENV